MNMWWNLELCPRDVGVVGNTQDILSLKHTLTHVQTCADTQMEKANNIEIASVQNFKSFI